MASSGLFSSAISKSVSLFAVHHAFHLMFNFDPNGAQSAADSICNSERRNVSKKHSIRLKLCQDVYYIISFLHSYRICSKNISRTGQLLLLKALKKDDYEFSLVQGF